MFGRARILLTIAASAVAMPVAAQAPGPTTTAFDGTYLAVSADAGIPASDIDARVCHPRPYRLPPPLTITNGVVRTVDEPAWVGTVSPQGAAVIRCPDSARVDAQIEPQGTIRGQFSGVGGSYTCLTRFVWQKGILTENIRAKA
jgi:hypothetical protein